jgi:thioredoxin-like negative regulator of GroEL
MESLIAHFAHKERERLRVAAVDVDERPDLAEKLRVSTVPALVLIDRRRVVARLEGRSSAPKIEALIEEHLDSGTTKAA